MSNIMFLVDYRYIVSLSKLQRVAVTAFKNSLWHISVGMAELNNQIIRSSSLLWITLY